MDGEKYINTECLSSIRDRILRAAACDEPVIISGERGTGKELVARLLHSPEKPLVAVNCACLEPELADSILFGHQRGAFTGAVRDNIGLIALADGGSLFLDEISLLPAGTRAKLLRFMTDGMIRMVGGYKQQHVRVRIIAAGNRDLQEMVGNGEFPADLHDRLDVLRIHVPPLRQFPNDITRLADFFLKEINTKRKMNIRLGKRAIQCLLNHNWLGNIRELRNAIIRGALFSSDKVISPENLEIGKPASKQFIFSGIINRRDMIKKLLKHSGPLKVSDLSVKCACTPRTIQKEIRRLIDDGYISSVKYGRSIYYKLIEEN